MSVVRPGGCRGQGWGGEGLIQPHRGLRRAAVDRCVATAVVAQLGSPLRLATSGPSSGLSLASSATTKFSTYGFSAAATPGEGSLGGGGAQAPARPRGGLCDCDSCCSVCGCAAMYEPLAPHAWSASVWVRASVGLPCPGMRRPPHAEGVYQRKIAVNRCRMPQVHGPLKKNPTTEKLIFRHLQKRGHPLSMKQEKNQFFHR